MKATLLRKNISTLSKKMIEKRQIKNELIPFAEIDDDLQMQTREWRNSPEVAEYFKIPHISVETHKKWLAGMKTEHPDHIAFLLRSNGQNAGVTYFHSLDRQNARGDWGIYIYPPEFRHRGIGHFALTACINYAQDKLKLEELFLDVMENNSAAVRLYESMGFVPTGEKDGRFLRYRLKLNPLSASTEKKKTSSRTESRRDTPPVIFSRTSQPAG